MERARRIICTQEICLLHKNLLFPTGIPSTDKSNNNRHSRAFSFFFLSTNRFYFKVEYPESFSPAFELSSQIPHDLLSTS